MRRKNPWAICTSSVGRKDKDKYERCVKSVKNEAIDEARYALAEACWKGYKAKGMKKKGNRMVPNCRPISEDEIQTKLPRPERMKRAAKKARQHGGDQVEAAQKALDRGTKKRDKEFYEQSNFSHHPAEEDINKPSNPVRKALQKRPPQQKNKPGKGRKLRKGQKPEYYLTRKKVMGSATKGKAQRANTGRMVQFTDGRQRSDDDERFGTPEPIDSINRRGIENKSARRKKLIQNKFKKLDALDPRT